MRVIISGGGTGGHIYPAIAIAEAIQKEFPDARIQFVGAEGKMEMEKVPKAGFPITGLPIRGLQRRLTWKNLMLPFKLWQSVRISKQLIRNIQPDIAIGVGGYASGPLLWVAGRQGVPTLIQEQNSYPGITNKKLAARAHKICVAFPDMERYFPKEKIVFTGNPIRQDLLDIQRKKRASQSFFDLGLKKTLLIFGGSLGAKTLNEAVLAQEETLRNMDDVNIIWQCGSRHFEACKSTAVAQLPHVKCLPFLERMDLAYAASDVVLCRAGALTLSELSVVGKAAVLVPSPNVAEDHQTKNALSLVQYNAAKMIKDQEAVQKALPICLDLLEDQQAREELESNIKSFAKPHAAEAIVNEIKNIINK